jgi:hypothetical protein
MVRLKRDGFKQNLGFSSRPFVLCGLPIKRPANGVLLHERRNGHFQLQVTDILPMDFRGGRIDLSQYSSQRWQFANKAKRFPFVASPKC